MPKCSVTGLALLSCLSGLLLAPALTGCASGRSQPSTQAGIEDRRTAQRVREALAAGADYRYDGVKVTACNGFVLLSGSVNTGAQRQRAEELTSKVAGVKTVENNLAVKD